jgi:hypothetical protein
MTIILPFHPGDAEIALAWLKWVSKLGNDTGQYRILLVADGGIDWTIGMKMIEAARCFNRQDIITLDKSISGWPEGPNALWKKAAQWAKANSTSFLWTEPDSVPITPNWITALHQEYMQAHKPFMGRVYRAHKPGFGEKLMSGIGIYPANAIDLIGIAADGDIAFDMAMTPTVLPMAHDTRLIHHFWGLRDLPPTFASERHPNSTVNTFTLDNVGSETVLFHRSKDLSLIRLLWNKYFPLEPMDQPVQVEPEAADIVSLRRAGDIINLFPLLQKLSKRENRPIRLVVAQEFKTLLDGVSYVEPVVWSGDWEDPVGAAKKHGAAIAQVFGRGLTPDIWNGNFAKMAWEQLGHQWNRYMPLVFDRRSLAREKELADNTFKTKRPKILVKLVGNSSPFGEQEWVRAQLEEFREQAELVDLDTLKAERIYDVIGLMDRAALVITVDTVAFWLAGASTVPVILFTNNTKFGASPPKGNVITAHRYAEVVENWSSIRKMIIASLHTPVNPGMILAFSDYNPTDPETISRQNAAYMTWPSLGARMFSAHPPRNSTALGDHKSMFYVRDIIDAAWQSGNEGVLVLTNNDIQFDTRLRGSIMDSCAKRGCWWAYRCESPQDRNTDQGADVFAFTRRWWALHSHFFPDFLMGYWWWDDMMVRIMQWSGCPEQERLYYHPRHTGVLNRLGSPGHIHNEKLANRWLLEHGEKREKP